MPKQLGEHVRLAIACAVVLVGGIALVVEPALTILLLLWSWLGGGVDRALRWLAGAEGGRRK